MIFIIVNHILILHTDDPEEDKKWPGRSKLPPVESLVEGLISPPCGETRLKTFSSGSVAKLPFSSSVQVSSICVALCETSTKWVHEFDASEYGFVLTIEIQDASFADCCSLIRVQGGQFEADHLQISDPTKVGIVSFNWSDQSETGLCWNVCAFPCLLEQMQAFACSQDTASKSFQPTEENSSID